MRKAQQPKIEMKTENKLFKIITNTIIVWTLYCIALTFKQKTWTLPLHFSHITMSMSDFCGFSVTKWDCNNTDCSILRSKHSSCIQTKSRPKLTPLYEAEDNVLTYLIKICWISLLAFYFEGCSAFSCGSVCVLCHIKSDWQWVKRFHSCWKVLCLQSSIIMIMHDHFPTLCCG